MEGLSCGGPTLAPGRGSKGGPKEARLPLQCAAPPRPLAWGPPGLSLEPTLDPCPGAEKPAGWEVKWPEGQETGALTKCQARHVSRHQHRPEPSPRGDTGLPGPRASSPDTAGSSCAWAPKLAGRRSRSPRLPFNEPCLQLTPRGSACSKATRHRVPAAAASAGRRRITDTRGRAALDPAQMEQPEGCNTQGTCAPSAVPGRRRLSHCWPGILHSTHANPLPNSMRKAGLPLGRKAARMKLGCWALLLHRQSVHGSPCTGECSPQREFGRNEEAKPS